MERCARCGMGLRPDANYCTECGARVRALNPDEEWECCEIVARSGWTGDILPKRYIIISAEARATGRIYPVAVHETRIPKEYGELGDEGRAAVEKIARELEDTGWEPVPEHGAQWWSYRFRRRVSLPFLTEAEVPAFLAQ